MDRWLAAVEKDTRDVPLSRKIVDDKPADIHDQCTDGARARDPERDRVLADQPDLHDAARSSRARRSRPTSTSAQLKPLRRSDYLPVVFTDAQWAQLRAAFPTGVCDWSKPGVDQQATIPWMTYEDTVGGRPLGSPPSSSSG